MTAIIISFSIFWLIFFMMILPIGIKVPKNIEKGHASSAPIEPYFGRKILISLALAFIFTIIYIQLINHYPNLKNIVNPW